MWLELFKDGLDHAVDVVEDVVVPEADDAVTVLLNLDCAGFVPVGLIGVLSAVQFNDEFLGWAGEIGNVRADWMLTSKASDAKLAQSAPKPLLGVGGVPSKCPRYFRSRPHWHAQL